MINEKLIDYIKSESGRGVSAESTKNALLVSGWKEIDIKKAYESLSTPNSVSGGSRKKLILISVVAILIVAGGIFAFMYWPFQTITENTPVAETIPTPQESLPAIIEPTTPPAPLPVLSDAEKVTTIMREICEGYLNGDISLVIKNSSIETANFLAGTKTNPTSSCVVNRVYQSGANMVANVTMEAIPPETAPATLSPVQDMDMVFINEDGIWKHDLSVTLKFVLDQKKAKALGGDQNGFIDLVVTNAVVSPKRPLVNSKDFKITFTIKNIGTKTSINGAPLVANLEGFKEEIPMSGGNYGPVLAGESIEWIWYPYKYNDAFKVADVAGQKTIKIELNPDRTVTENDYANNIFTQNVQVYAK